jgi:hypothetical protein
MHPHQSYVPYPWPGPSCDGDSTKWDLYPSHHEVDTPTS